MTTDELTAALHACASGLYPLEAGVALLISSGAFLRRSDFAGRFIEHPTSSGVAMAAIDWEAAVTALGSGELPCSGGERRVLRLPASPTESPSTSATSPPTSTTAISNGWSPRSGMRPEDGPSPGNIDDRF
jgi:hypothetical protein